MPVSKTFLTRTIRLFSGSSLLWGNLLVLALNFSALSMANAETRYVTDRLILNLRSGPTTSHRITRTLSSGSAVNVIKDRPPENGHVLVTVGSDSEGWVLEQYLQNEPIARTQVAQLKRQVETLKNQASNLKEKLENATTSLDNTAQQQTEIATQLETKESELQQIRALSANAIEIDQRNTELTKANQNLQLEIDKLKAENDRLSGSEQRTQWMTGAALVLIGLFCSWIISNFSGRRKSNWS